MNSESLLGCHLDDFNKAFYEQKNKYKPCDDHYLPSLKFLAGSPLFQTNDFFQLVLKDEATQHILAEGRRQNQKIKIKH